MLGAFALILLGLVCKQVFDFLMGKKVIPFLERTRFRFDALLARAAGKPLGWCFLLVALSGAFSILSLPTEPNVEGFAFGALKVLLAIVLVWFLFRVVDVAMEYLEQLARRTESRLDDELVPVIRKALKMTVGVLCALWTVQLLGYKVSTLIAGLGIGGLAVALALQDTLGNFFGSVVIFLDRPYTVGDWIKVGETEGIVEQIGFRSTRLRTWPASQVSIPNKTMANAIIDNWSKMPKRRVMQTVGVTYETSAEEMEQAVAAIRQIVENDEGVDKEFIVIRFTDFGGSSLDILLYYYTIGVSLAEHLETKERINLAVMRALSRMGLSIAFPTQTVYFEGEVARSMTRRLSEVRSRSEGDEGQSGRQGGTSGA